MKNLQQQMKLYIFCFLALFFLKSAAQSLDYNDLINLQGSDLPKVKGFFNYKGWTWSKTTENERGAFMKGDYKLTYTNTIWSNNSETVDYLTQNHCSNIIIYYTDIYNFNSIESDTKTKCKLIESESKDNILYSEYKKDSVHLVFNIKKVKNWSSYNTYYEICVWNENDVLRIINSYCDECKGLGQIEEHEPCSHCDGTGRKYCDNCRGYGKIICGYCDKGKTSCNACMGKGSFNCNQCWGKGTINCNFCYGQGTITCNNCYGQGTVLLSYNGVNIKIPCKKCNGKGKLTCSNCSGVGNFKCTNCNGVGNVKCNSCGGTGQFTCTHCFGDYTKTCTICNGAGHTDEICSYCNGTGKSERTVIHVCPKCKGNGLKE